MAPNPTQTLQQPPAMMKTREVAEAFGVNINAVHQWADAGKIRSTRTPGGHRRYYAEEIAVLLAPDTEWAVIHAPQSKTEPGLRPCRDRAHAEAVRNGLRTNYLPAYAAAKQPDGEWVQVGRARES